MQSPDEWDLTFITDKLFHQVTSQKSINSKAPEDRRWKKIKVKETGQINLWTQSKT